MKKIEAIVRVSNFQEVDKALHEVGVYFYTYWNVSSIGKEKEEHTYRGTVYDPGFIPRRFLQIIVSDELKDKVVQAIVSAGQTGEKGDGKVFVFDVIEGYRIINGEKISEGYV